MNARTPLLGCLVTLAACSGGGRDATTAPGGPVLTSVVISGATTLTVGQTSQLSAAPKDQNGATIGASVVWRSSAPGVAAVDSGGLVSGISAGSAAITASAIAGTVTVSNAVQLTVSAPRYPATATVTMPGLVFAPFQVDLAAAGTVRFEFPALAHNVVFDNVAGKPADISPTANATVSRVFATRGTFTYQCTLHPGMSGQVVVH